MKVEFLMDGSIINYPARCSVRLYLQLFVGGLCLTYVFCVSLHIVVSKTHCVVFLFCFSSSSCLPYVASFSGVFILIKTFGGLTIN